MTGVDCLPIGGLLELHFWGMGGCNKLAKILVCTLVNSASSADKQKS
jgi:hypothetical protein